MGKGLLEFHGDEEVTGHVHCYLAKQHFPQFLQLRLHVLKGALTIEGRLNSYYEKQVALATCQQVPGVRTLVDHIAVVDNCKLAEA